MGGASCNLCPLLALYWLCPHLVPYLTSQQHQIRLGDSPLVRHHLHLGLHRSDGVLFPPALCQPLGRQSNVLKAKATVYVVRPEREVPLSVSLPVVEPNLCTQCHKVRNFLLTAGSSPTSPVLELNGSSVVLNLLALSALTFPPEQPSQARLASGVVVRQQTLELTGQRQLLVIRQQCENQLSEAFAFHKRWRLEVHDKKVDDSIGHLSGQNQGESADETAGKCERLRALLTCFCEKAAFK